jgi:oligopeptide/dipeptide ABC transporter ATP-binding protein
VSLLVVDSLSVAYGSRPVLHDISFSLDRGESLGLVGLSGSGKTQTALAILGLLPDDADVRGRVRFEETDLLEADTATLLRLRGQRIAMVFQDPSLALNPYLTIGQQLGAILKTHRLAPADAVRDRVIAALARVGLPDPGEQVDRYPHQLSGGMRQRTMIAAALLGEPDILIADEPTTALDVTVQAEILDLLDEIRGDTALLLITHDLGIVAGRCERMLVIDAGRVVETDRTAGLFKAPRMPLTRSLLADALTLSEEPPPPGDGDILLSADRLGVSYPVSRRRELVAVRDQSFAIREGETLAIVGESGSGKSSLARAVLGLVPPASGRVLFRDEPLPATLDARPLALKRDLSLVFQDPPGSLSPSMRVSDILAEPLRVHSPALGKAERRERVEAVAASVGLEPSLLDRYPHQLSGGQAQRVAVARAIVLKPKLLVCDEAVAALDGRTRRRILDLLQAVQAETGLAMLFITHDIAVAQSIAHRVAVMYLGRIVEIGATRDVFGRPRHPYTRALIDAVPLPDPLAPGGVATLSGELPSALEPPAGCAFQTRCPRVEERCRDVTPQLEPVGGSRVACLRAKELDLGRPGQGRAG